MLISCKKDQFLVIIVKNVSFNETHETQKSRNQEIIQNIELLNTMIL